MELLAISEENKTQQQDERVFPDWELELIDKELEQLFNNQLVMMNHSKMAEIESQQKLAKLKIPRELQKAADRILGFFLREAEIITEIMDKVYAMGKR